VADNLTDALAECAQGTSIKVGENSSENLSAGLYYIVVAANAGGAILPFGEHHYVDGVAKRWVNSPNFFDLVFITPQPISFHGAAIHYEAFLHSHDIANPATEGYERGCPAVAFALFLLTLLPLVCGKQLLALLPR